MKIFVSIKQVPARDSNLRVDAGGKWLDESDLTFEMNEPDAYALEEALQLRDKTGGEVVVVCAGPDRAGQTIREALAKGADRAIHIRRDEPASADSLVTARLLAKVLAEETPDLILTGLQSDDLGYGQTGVILAELLGMAHATIVMEVEIAASELRVRRELEDGWFQHIQLPLPAVLTIQSGIKKLRYATLMGIKKARTKEVKVVEADSVPAEASAAIFIERVYLPERKKQTQLLTGDPRQAAARLIEKLRFEARVL
jgi:electron transfer flavoprotein beta subunit